jgi:NAD(P)-dependent dehydrogenase (short-subunit alcohol dehydrogenase family)
MSTTSNQIPASPDPSSRTGPGVVLVTGAATGMGRDMAIRLAATGWSVGICDVNEDGLQETVAAASAGGTCVAWTADIAVGADVTRFVEEAESRLGPIDALVNNALHAVEGFVLELSEADWRRAIDVSLTGYFLCAQAAGRRMVQRSYGRIVNFSSGAAERGIPRTAAYGSAKGGVNSFTRVLAVELAASGVTVNTLTTGPIMTEGFRLLAKSEEGIEARRRRIPVGRFGTADDYLPVLEFLISPQAGWTTGGLFHVDGGANNAALVQSVTE